MSRSEEVTYELDFGAGRKIRSENKPAGSAGERPEGEACGPSIPRISRLMALALRFERLVQNQSVRDYAELARRGRVSRARMAQIMKLLHLAPDIQEQLLFLSRSRGLHERTLRPVVSRIDWDEQRTLFRKLIDRGHDGAGEPD